MRSPDLATERDQSVDSSTSHPEGREPLGLSSVGLAMLCAALWGGTAVAIRFSVDTLPPVGLAGLRFGIAAIFMWFWCCWERSGLRLEQGQLRPVLWSGVLLFFQIATFNVGVQWSNSTHGSLFVNTYIFWVVAAERFVSPQMRLTARKLSGLILAAAGCALVMLLDINRDQAAATSVVGDQATLAGDVMLMASAFILGIKTVYTKVATRVVEPGKLMFWHDIVGTVLFALYSIAFEETTLGDFSMPAVLGLLYQAIVVGGFCFAVSARLLQRHAASEVSVFSFATPLFGLALGVWLRGDALSPWLLVSGVSVATGIWLVTQ